MKYLFVFLIFLASLPVLAQETLNELLLQHNEQTVSYISGEELRNIQKGPELLLLDTREREEYEVSRIEGAISVGYTDFSLKKIRQIASDKNQIIVVYCSLGIRSEDIGEKLKRAGYTKVKNLYGGIFAWKNSGFPVVDSQGKETEKVHAYSRKWSKWLHKGEKIF